MISTLAVRHHRTALLLVGDGWYDGLTAATCDDQSAARRALRAQRERRAAIAARRSDLRSLGPLDDLRLLRDLVRLDDDIVALSRLVIEQRCAPGAVGRPLLTELRDLGVDAFRHLCETLRGPWSGVTTDQLSGLREELLAVTTTADLLGETWQGLGVDLATTMQDALRHSRGACRVE